MIIIPDVHGRTFWKSALKGKENEEILFLGDYVDPYSSFEDVEPQAGMHALMEVIEFKKQHMDNVTLLLGNHDLSYISSTQPKCRHDYDNELLIGKMIEDNRQLFRLAHEKQIAGKHFIFSHAGILPGWLEYNEPFFGHLTFDNCVEELNTGFQNSGLDSVLCDVSNYRGGYFTYGSCVWADVNEHIDYFMFAVADSHPEVYQVFGHTLLTSGHPFITEHFACLDCRKAIFLDEKGRFTVL